MALPKDTQNYLKALKHFSVREEQNRLLVTWDMPEEKMNLVTPEMLDELDRIVECVSRETALTGVILRSGKKTFSPGFDLKVLRKVCQAYQSKKGALTQKERQDFYEELKKINDVYRRIETCGKPWVVLITGMCMGGGLELALACHARLATNVPPSVLGLPEVQVGLCPGGGGTQRVLRMTRAEEGLRFILTGRPVSAIQAHKMGLIDGIAKEEQLLEQAHALLDKGLSAARKWDVVPPLRPNDGVYAPEGRQFWAMATALYRQASQDLYPGTRAALRACFEGLQLPMDQALDRETRFLLWALSQPSCLAMMETNFFAPKVLGALPARPKSVPETKFKKIGIVGAGFMGAALAHVSGLSGSEEIILLDQDEAHAQKGKAFCEKMLTEDMAKGRLPATGLQKVLERLKPTSEYASLRGCDLVIEAVYEDMEIKKQVLTRIGAAIDPEKTVVASNTSSLSISAMAEFLPIPERFAGIHFFSPVHKMKLVEVVQGKKTDAQALACAFDFAKHLKKIPVHVHDSCGFFVNTVLFGYLIETFAMLQEGVPPVMVENLACAAGMPMGPLALVDAVGLETSQRIFAVFLSSAEKMFCEENLHFVKECLDSMIAQERRGKKNGKGFYNYPEKGKKHLWPALEEIVGAAKPAEDFNIQELKERFLLVQGLTAAKCFEKGVIREARGANVASVFGTGFAPFTGGVVSYIDQQGAVAFVEKCDALEKRYGPRFKAPHLLREMASKDECFSERF